MLYLVMNYFVFLLMTRFALALRETEDLLCNKSTANDFVRLSQLSLDDESLFVSWPVGRLVFCVLCVGRVFRVTVGTGDPAAAFFCCLEFPIIA